MLFGKQNSKVKGIMDMNIIVFLPLFIAILIAISACTDQKGSIVILEKPNGTGFTMDFIDWSSKNKCELSLNEGDEVQIETIRENGEIALKVIGKNGSEPYTGKNLESGIFTVTVSETDIYEIRITGKDATGKVIAKNVSSNAK